MAGVKISELPDADPTTGAELIELLQGGVNVKTTLATIFAGVSYSEESFTATLGGVAESITGTATYIKFGNLVSITIPQLTEGTSNSSLFWIEGLPVDLRPSSSVIVSCAGTLAFLINGNPPATDEQVSAYINTVGSIFFIHGSSNSWTYPSTKGIAYPVTITYMVI